MCIAELTQRRGASLMGAFVLLLACSGEEIGGNGEGAEVGTHGDATTTGHEAAESSGSDDVDETEAATSDATEEPEDCPPGAFETEFSVLEDECGSAPFIGYDDKMTVEVETTTMHSLTIEIVDDHGLEAVPGTIEAACTFVATGEGTVAAYPNIRVDWEGTLTEDGIVGTLALGADGGLPGGCPVVYALSPA